MTTPSDSEEFRASGPETPPLPPPPAVIEPRDSAPSPAQELTRFPALAAFLALVPGLGHLYVGAYQRAAMLVIGIICVCIVIPLPINVFLALFLWFFGIFDAYRQAQLANLTVRGTKLEPPSTEQGSLAFGVFLTVVGVVLLLRNFDLIDLEWLRDWWPAIPVVVGIYLIASAVAERRRQRPRGTEDGEGLGE